MEKLKLCRKHFALLLTVPMAVCHWGYGNHWRPWSSMLRTKSVPKLFASTYTTVILLTTQSSRPHCGLLWKTRDGLAVIRFFWQQSAVEYLATSRSGLPTQLQRFVCAECNLNDFFPHLSFTIRRWSLCRELVAFSCKCVWCTTKVSIYLW